MFGFSADLFEKRMLGTWAEKRKERLERPRRWVVREREGEGECVCVWLGFGSR